MRSLFGIRVAAVFAAAALSLSAAADIVVGPWTPIYRGVEFARGEATVGEPRVQKVTAVRIDLWDPTVSFFTTPDNGDAPLETFGQTVSTFLTTHNLAVAVNANFFSPCCANTLNEPKDVIGLSISDGVQVSPPVDSGSGTEVLLITQGNVASFASTTTPVDLTGVWNAVAGSPRLLTDGVNLHQPGGSTPEPRTAAGLTEDNRYLVFITIDGRQTGFSDGADFHETAAWLVRFGAYNGINLDGGGSTTLVRNDGAGGPIILNRPIHGNAPGAERINGNNIGVRARLLPPPCKVTYAETVTAAGPLAYWRLGEASGIQAVDSVGDFDGEYVGGVTLGHPGALKNDADTSVLLNGASPTKIDPGFDPLLNPEGSFTIAAWARLDDPANSYRAVISARNDPPQAGYIIYSGPADAVSNPRWQFWTGPGAFPWNHMGRNRNGLLVGPTVQTGAWTFVVATFADQSGPIFDPGINDTKYQGRMTFFLNGESVMYTDGRFYLPNPSRPLWIGAGANEGAGTFWWPGAIDEVAIWDRALSPAEIENLHRIGRFRQPFCQGDMNCDGVVNFGDIDPFVLALTGQAAHEAAYPNCNWLYADTQNDGQVNFSDIDPFVAILSM